MTSIVQTYLSPSLTCRGQEFQYGRESSISSYRDVIVYYLFCFHLSFSTLIESLAQDPMQTLLKHQVAKLVCVKYLDTKLDFQWLDTLI